MKWCVREELRRRGSHDLRAGRSRCWKSSAPLPYTFFLLVLPYTIRRQAFQRSVVCDDTACAETPDQPGHVMTGHTCRLCTACFGTACFCRRHSRERHSLAALSVSTKVCASLPPVWVGSQGQYEPDGNLKAALYTTITATSRVAACDFLRRLDHHPIVVNCTRAHMHAENDQSMTFRIQDNKHGTLASELSLLISTGDDWANRVVRKPAVASVGSSPVY